MKSRVGDPPHVTPIRAFSSRELRSLVDLPNNLTDSELSSMRRRPHSWVAFAMCTRQREPTKYLAASLTSPVTSTTKATEASSKSFSKKSLLWQSVSPFRTKRYSKMPSQPKEGEKITSRSEKREMLPIYLAAPATTPKSRRRKRKAKRWCLWAPKITQRDSRRCRVGLRKQRKTTAITGQQLLRRIGAESALNLPAQSALPCAKNLRLAPLASRSLRQKKRET